METPVSKRTYAQRVGIMMIATSCIVWGLGASGLLVYGNSRRAPVVSVDAILVAGCHVTEDGVASKALTRRTVKAVELYRQGVAPLLVFTGGLGTFPPTEAEAAAVVARSLGVPEDAILLEGHSTSTEENARFAARDFPQLQRVVVVSDSYHILRSERVFRRYFSQVHGVGSPPKWDVSIRGALREVLALGWYAWKGRL